MISLLERTNKSSPYPEPFFFGCANIPKSKSLNLHSFKLRVRDSGTLGYTVYYACNVLNDQSASVPAGKGSAIIYGSKLGGKMKVI